MNAKNAVKKPAHTPIVKTKPFIACAVAVVLGGIGFGTFKLNHLNEQNTTIVPVRLDREIHGDKSTYIVGAQDCLGKPVTYKNVDDWMVGKFSSSDLQTTLARNINRPVDIRAYGFRSGFFSMFPNITRARPSKTTTCSIH